MMIFKMLLEPTYFFLHPVVTFSVHKRYWIHFQHLAGHNPIKLLCPN